jgi:predicted pyridoxine 5'-phosphate oxidase superfamily flavin-nucleotide-binding protein
MPDDRDLDAYFAARSTDPVAEHLSSAAVRSLGNRRRAGRYARNAVALVAVFALGGFTVTNLTRQPTAVPAGQVASTMARSSAASPSSSASSASARTTSTPNVSVKPVVKAGDLLTTTGIGELTLGMSTSELGRRGVVNGELGDCSIDETPTLTAEGVAIYGVGGTVTGIQLATAQHATTSGIRIGATVAEIESAYGSSLTVKTITYGSTQTTKLDVLVVSSGGHDMIFLTANQTMDPTDTVRRIVVIYDGYQVLDTFC